MALTNRQQHRSYWCAGLIMSALGVLAIRTQFLITEQQYLKGMIPHHSMAVFMSKKMSETPNNIQHLLSNIIKSQEEEIAYIKTKLSSSSFTNPQ